MFASFQNVLFVFDNGTDDDLAVYEYELYEEGDIVNPNTTPYALQSGATPLSAGAGNSSVFAVPVEGSYIDVENDNIVVQRNFFGRVRAKDTSGNIGTWTAIVKTDPSTPLIDSQYIVSLTADKIKAGTIESAEIVLGGANPEQTVIRSSTYDGTYSSGSGQWSTGSTGWLISGNGQAIFDATQIRGSVSAASINLNTHNYWLPSGSTATFKVGSASQYLLFDGTNLSLSGSLSGASGTFTGRVEVGGVDIGNDVGPGTGHYGISLSSGDFNNIFLRRSDGVYFFRVGYGGANSISWDSSSGILNVAGSITATSGSIGGWSLNSSQIIAGSVVGDDSYGQYITLNSSASLVAYRKDFNYGLGEYWTKVDVNSGNPGITITGNSNGYDNTSAIRSSNISTRLFIHNEYTAGTGYGKFTATGSHVYFGDGSGSYTMRIVNSAGLYGQGTGGAATLDVLVNANGTLVAPSSSIRFKENVNNLNVDYKKILSIQPVSFFYKDDSEIPEGEQRAVEYGVIAEQVEEAGVPELVNYKDGVPFSVPYSKMPVFLLEVCRKQQELIENLESRISLLES